MANFIRGLIVAVGILLPALAAEAQTIAGIVRDESGAVMPGVTVEAASPALIEKVRAATTDAGGQYRIVNLSPGVYVVTFTLLRADANLYNVFNNDFVNSVNTTFSTTGANQFMRPTNVLQGRLFKIGGQIEFQETAENAA